jgi:pimeloyl-ACP methyl ester carboxylesterase
MQQLTDEGMFVRVNDVEQWITIRGAKRTNPVLFMISGPGVSFSRLAPFFAHWERDYTLAQWDQPGAGATASLNGDKQGTISFERITRDGLAVAEFIRSHLQADRLVLLGISGGSIVGLKMVTRRPDLFAAYVGTGQIVDWPRQEALSYEMLMAQARARGDQTAVAELTAIGPPPYDDVAKDMVKSKYASALTAAEQAVFAGLDPSVTEAMRTPPPHATYVPRGLPAVDQRTQSLAVYRALRPEMVAFDARAMGVDYPLPMFFIQGEQDAYTVTSEVQAYCQELRAPAKQVVIVEGGGHSAVFLRDPFLVALNRVLR